jgi:CheY-like chemotaxis protein
MRNRKKFGEILLESGAVKPQDLDKALQLQKGSGLALGRILEDMGAIAERDVTRILARQFRLPLLDTIASAPVPGSLLQRIDYDTAIRLMVFPLVQQKGKLYLAITNPLDFSTLDRLAFIAGMPIRPVLATADTILKAIRRFYLRETGTDADSRERILLVGHPPPGPPVLMLKLEQKGYRVAAAADAMEAVHLSLKNAPHLLVADIDRDAGKGVSFFKKFQSNDATRGRPVIALSSFARAEEEAMLLRLGYFDFATKPVSPVRLLARIERALRFAYREKPGLPETAARSGAAVGSSG